MPKSFGAPNDTNRKSVTVFTPAELGLNNVAVPTGGAFVVSNMIDLSPYSSLALAILSDQAGQFFLQVFGPDQATLLSQAAGFDVFDFNYTATQAYYWDNGIPPSPPPVAWVKLALGNTAVAGHATVTLFASTKGL